MYISQGSILVLLSITFKDVLGICENFNSYGWPVAEFCKSGQFTGSNLIFDGYPFNEDKEEKQPCSCSAVVSTSNNGSFRLVFSKLASLQPGYKWCGSSITIKDSDETIVQRCYLSGSMTVKNNDKINLTLSKDNSPDDTRYCMTMMADDSSAAFSVTCFGDSEDDPQRSTPTVSSLRSTTATSAFSTFVVTDGRTGTTTFLSEADKNTTTSPTTSLPADETTIYSSLSKTKYSTIEETYSQTLETTQYSTSKPKIQSPSTTTSLLSETSQPSTSPSSTSTTFIKETTSLSKETTRTLDIYTTLSSEKTTKFERDELSSTIPSEDITQPISQTLSSTTETNVLTTNSSELKTTHLSTTKLPSTQLKTTITPEITTYSVEPRTTATTTTKVDGISNRFTTKIQTNIQTTNVDSDKITSQESSGVSYTMTSSQTFINTTQSPIQSTGTNMTSVSPTTPDPQSQASQDSMNVPVEVIVPVAVVGGLLIVFLIICVSCGIRRNVCGCNDELVPSNNKLVYQASEDIKSREKDTYVNPLYDDISLTGKSDRSDRDSMMQEIPSDDDEDYRIPSSTEIDGELWTHL